MRCSCFRTVDVPGRLMRLLCGFLVLHLAAAALSVQARALDRNCALGEPTVSEKGTKITLQIKLTCGVGDATGAAMATGKDYLIGLTLYALGPRSGGDEGVDGLLEKAASGVVPVDGGDLEIVQKPGPAGKIERRIITDKPFGWTFKPYDLPAQQLRISAGARAVTFGFTADKEKIAGYNYLLFALWPASQKRACKRDGDRARSGCTAYGYVIGDEGGVNPVDYYPGMATFNSDIVQGLTQWVVEKFR